MSDACLENLNHAIKDKKLQKSDIFSYIHGHFSFFKIAHFGELREGQAITENQSTVSYETNDACKWSR